MLTPVDIAQLALSGFFCILGLMGNTLIVAVNLMNWIRSISELNPNDILVSSLGFNNICLTSLSFATDVCYFFWREILFLEIVFNSTMCAIWFLGDSSLWLATWLCVYYCMRIVNFSHPSFIWMKERLPKIVHQLLMGSLIISLAIRAYQFWGINSIKTSNMSSSLSSNTSSNIYVNGTNNDVSTGSGWLKIVIIEFLVTSVAFMLFCLSAVAIIASLYRHMRRMDHHAGGFRRPQLSAHVCAIKTVTTLLILYASNYLANRLIMSDVFPSDTLGFIICQIVFNAFPTLSSIILILGNVSLKKTLFKIFGNIKCCKGKGIEHASRTGAHSISYITPKNDSSSLLR